MRRLMRLFRCLIKAISSSMAVTLISLIRYRRSKDLEAQGFRFIGTGVSGGEEGALKGPSIMPGGQESAYKSG